MSTPTRRPSRPAAPPRRTLAPADTGDWRDNAECRRHDPALFFPAGRSEAALHQIEQAKTVCQSCPVARTCLEWALRSNQYTGVWGGLSADERRGMYYGQGAAFMRCLEDQEYIEGRLAADVAGRQVARELGVPYEVLRRARRFFEAERAQQPAETAEGVEAA